MTQPEASQLRPMSTKLPELVNGTGRELIYAILYYVARRAASVRIHSVATDCGLCIL